MNSATSKPLSDYDKKYDYLPIAQKGRKTAPDGWGGLNPGDRIKFAIENNLLPHFPTFYAQGWMRGGKVGGNHYDFNFTEGENFNFEGCLSLNTCGCHRKDLNPVQTQGLIDYLESIETGGLSEKAIAYIKNLVRFLKREFSLA